MHLRDLHGLDATIFPNLGSSADIKWLILSTRVGSFHSVSLPAQLKMILYYIISCKLLKSTVSSSILIEISETTHMNMLETQTTMVGKLG